MKFIHIDLYLICFLPDNTAKRKKTGDDPIKTGQPIEKS